MWDWLNTNYNQLQSIGSLATAFGILLLFIQLFNNAKLIRTQFEDGLNKEYRDMLVSLLDQERQKYITTSGNGDQTEKYSIQYYKYFDFCNEQIFLWKRRRISNKTFIEWIEGIKGNMNDKKFEENWRVISNATDDFRELRSLIHSNYYIKSYFLRKLYS